MSSQLKFNILLTLIICGGLFLLFKLVYHDPVTDLKPSSSLVLSPTAAVSPTPESEPIVSLWRKYSNEKYNFTVDVPKDWKEQEYSSFYPNGGTLIAFSAGDLPCGTCTYLNEGYFSIKVYNEKSDPQAYAYFSQKKKALGKNKELKGVYIDNITGIYFGNSIAVENKGWVYEMTYDKNEGKEDYMSSEIMKKVASGFKFTHLIFSD